MPDEKSSRKWQITINNPIVHNFSHDQLKLNLAELKSIKYWCMCDEVGEEGTPHTHIYLAAENAIKFSTLKKRFYEAHLEPCKGTNEENRDYIRKEGKYENSLKKGTNIPETFEEWGELPVEKRKTNTQSEEIRDMIKKGCTNYDIIEKFPSAMNRLQNIDKTRQIYLEEGHNTQFRILKIVYIFGSTGVGKTKYVMETFGYENVYRINKYSNPFDSYKQQDIILFDEFHSQIPITEMLTYLDGYPCNLPCRYNDKVACYTKVFIISNLDLNKQYNSIQVTDKETWKAFVRRISEVKRFEKDGSIIVIDKDFYVDGYFTDIKEI